MYAYIYQFIPKSREIIKCMKHFKGTPSEINESGQLRETMQF